MCPLPYVHPCAFTLDLLVPHRPFPSRPLTSRLGHEPLIWNFHMFSLWAILLPHNWMTRCTACPVGRASLSDVFQPERIESSSKYGLPFLPRSLSQHHYPEAKECLIHTHGVLRNTASGAHFTAKEAMGSTSRITYCTIQKQLA